jgi:hypothetical protein
MSSTIQTSNKASYTDLRRVLTEMPPNNTISSRANKSNEQTTRNMQDDHQVNKKKEDDMTVATATIASCPLVDDRGPIPHDEDMFVRVYSVLPEEKSEQNGADKKSATDVDDKDDRDDDEKDDGIPRRESSWMDDVIRAHEQGGCAVDVLKELVPIVAAERIDTSDRNDDADSFSSKEVDDIKETTITKPSLGFMKHPQNQYYMDTQSFAAKIRREVQASLARKS